MRWMFIAISACVPCATHRIRLAKRSQTWRRGAGPNGRSLTRSVTEPERHVMLVASEGEHVLGSAYGLIDRDRSEAARVGGTWVEPAWRRRGVGRALLQEMFGWAREHGLSRHGLWARHTAPPRWLYTAKRVFERPAPVDNFRPIPRYRLSRWRSSREIPELWMANLSRRCPQSFLSGPKSRVSQASGKERDRHSIDAGVYDRVWRPRSYMYLARRTGRRLAPDTAGLPSNGRPTDYDACLGSR
jgi:GNAT superfamily N-acetyltransferase